MITTYLHLGSNQGIPLKHILQALAMIEEEVGMIHLQSRFFKTEAWGMPDQDDFINMAIAVRTNLSAEQLLASTQWIEQQIGRNQKDKWGPRNIDIDILYYDDHIVDKEGLSIPHTQIEKRNFVLIPLMEIASDFVDPLRQKTIEELYLASQDKCEVILL